MNAFEKETLFQFDKVCRLCLSRKRAMLPILEDGMSFPIASRILTYVGIEVSTVHGLPTMICNNCRNRIDAWHKFKEQCKHCDDVLHQCIARNMGFKVKAGKTCNGQIPDTNISSQEIIMQKLVTNETERTVVWDVKNGSSLQRAEESRVKIEPESHNVASHRDKDAKEGCVIAKGLSSSPSKSDVLDNSTIPYHDFDADSAKSEMGLDNNESDDDKPVSAKLPKNDNNETDKNHTKGEEHLDYKTYGCSKCGNSFSYTNNFTFHLCNLTPEKRFVCNLCGKDYSTAGAVKTHLHIHKGKHKCPTCSKSFPSKFQVDVHMRIHTGEKPYVCEYCGKRFAYDKGLTLHMSVHTGIKPYKCDECNYSTTSRSYIKNHKSVHRTEKPFVCEICGQGYTLLPSLMNHQLNHNDQKTYECDVCNKAFNTSRKLASHKIMHSGVRPYHCEDCGKRFARKEGLKEHKVIHTGEKKFACLMCKRQFAWRKILRTHKCPGSSECSN